MVSSEGEFCDSNRFREDLQNIFNTVVNNIDSSASTSSMPVEIDGPSLIQKFAKTISSRNYLVCSNNTTHATAQVMNWQNARTLALGSFSILPREVRDIIYTHIATDGSVAIMQCSSVLQKEMSTPLFDHGCCHLNFNFSKKSHLALALNPSQELANKIQNLSIRVNTRCNGTFGPPIPDVELLTKFRGSVIRRNRCSVVFDCFPSTEDMVASNVVEELRQLTGFQEIVIMIELLWSDVPWPECLYPFQVSQIMRNLDCGFIKAEYELDGTLGEAVRDGDGKCRRLLFHPSEPQSEAVMEARKKLNL